MTKLFNLIDNATLEFLLILFVTLGLLLFVVYVMTCRDNFNVELNEVWDWLKYSKDYRKCKARILYLKRMPFASKKRLQAVYVKFIDKFYNDILLDYPDFSERFKKEIKRTSKTLIRMTA